MNITKESIATALINSGFELNGKDDYQRIQAAVKQAYNVKLSHKAVWALINYINESIEVIDFD